MTVYYDADRVQPGAFPALLAIGDSWFWYPFVSNLLAEISAVVKPDYSNILTLGKVGATLEQFAVGRHAPQLARQLRPQNIIYYSALLVSGGAQRRRRLGPVPEARLHGAAHRGGLPGRAEAR